LKLFGMAKALKEWGTTSLHDELSHESFIGMLVGLLINGYQ